MQKITTTWTLTRTLMMVLMTVAAIRLIYAGWVDSMDFTVYWKAAQTWIRDGKSPYLYGAADRGFVFKYPPWILPLFMPLGFLNCSVSKVVWGLGEVLCIGYAVRWVRAQGVSWLAALLSLALFWWIFLGHFFAGQFTLLLMAAALWWERNRKSDLCTAVLVTVFSAKVFSMVSLLGALKSLLRLRVWVYGLVIAVGATFFVEMVLVLKGSPVSFSELLLSWGRAALSGGDELPDFVIRGQMNHGFTAGILRNLGVDAKMTRFDIMTCLGLTAVLGTLWKWASTKLQFAEKWAGWLALGLIVHPLAWHHSFVLAYPLCTLALDRSLQAKQRQWIALSLLGTACIGILIPNVIGPDWVRPLELVSVKSWGVCFAAAALCLAKGQKD